MAPSGQSRFGHHLSLSAARISLYRTEFRCQETAVGESTLYAGMSGDSLMWLLLYVICAPTSLLEQTMTSRRHVIHVMMGRLSCCPTRQVRTLPSLVLASCEGLPHTTSARLA